MHCIWQILQQGIVAHTMNIYALFSHASIQALQSFFACFCCTENAFFLSAAAPQDSNAFAVVEVKQDQIIIHGEGAVTTRSLDV